MQNIILGIDINKEAHNLDHIEAPEFFSRLSERLLPPQHADSIGCIEEQQHYQDSNWRQGLWELEERDACCKSYVAPNARQRGNCRMCSFSESAPAIEISEIVE